MKIKSLVYTVGSLGCAAFIAVAPVKAGPMMAPIDPVPIDTGISNLLDPIETTLSVGFDSHYMFRGYNLGEEAVWAGIDMSLPLGWQGASLDFGLWYVNPTEGPSNTSGIGGPAFNAKRGIPDDELDAYIGVSGTWGPVDVSVGYVHYFLGPEAANNPLAAVNDQNEVGTTLGTSFGPIDFGFEYAYNFDLDTAKSGTWEFQHYWEPSVGTGFEVNDRISLNLSVAAGFYGDDFSHWQFGLSAPIVVAENVTFEPYVAYLDDRKPANIASPFTQDSWFGGVSLSVSF